LIKKILHSVPEYLE
jgi:hypothetical protein